MARKPTEDPQLDMTPMIDVVFELIIFFVITIKQQDILSRLNVNRPQPASSSAEQTDEQVVEIQVGGVNYRKAEYVYKGKAYTLKTIDAVLKEMADVSSGNSQIVIKCELKSPHKGLVDLLDVCYKYKLTNVNVFSM